MSKAFVVRLLDLDSISLSSGTKTLTNGTHSYPAWRSAQKNRVKKKPANSITLSLSKILTWVPPSLCGRQVVGTEQSTRGGDQD